MLQNFRAVSAIAVTVLAIAIGFVPSQGAQAADGLQVAEAMLRMPYEAVRVRIVNTIEDPQDVGARMIEPWAELGDQARIYAMEHPQTVAFVAGCTAAVVMKNPSECQTWGTAATEVLNKIIAEQIWRF